MLCLFGLIFFIIINLLSRIKRLAKINKYICLSYIIYFLISVIKENSYFKKSKLIEENFFILDSNNLDKIESHMYGFCVSTKGILTNNYYKNKGFKEEPEIEGVYVLIRKKDNEISLNQDFYGSFGIYIYENKDKNYFAISNSFLYLFEYLVGKQELSLNKDYSDNLIISNLFIASTYETLVNEITKIPSNKLVKIKINEKRIFFHKIDYEENTIPFESHKGLKIIDKWADKWGYIIRSLKKKTNNISLDLSGGFDTRALLAFIFSSNINLNEIYIRSIHDNISTHEQDYAIAKNISSKFGFMLNKLNNTLNRKKIKWGLKDSLYNEFYTRLGFHKGLSWNNFFYIKPRFSFTGGGGENIRGCPCMAIEDYIAKLSKYALKVNGYENLFKSSFLRMINRSITSIKEEHIFQNDFEIAYFLHTKLLSTNHYGKASLKSFLKNLYSFQPLMDPYLKRLKFDIKDKLPHDLLAYIYIRFAPDLISFPFEGNRILKKKSIQKALILNKSFHPYDKKKDYNKNFYIDLQRKSPVKSLDLKTRDIQYLNNFFESREFKSIINKIYDKNVYNWAQEYKYKSNHFPMRHNYALLAIAKVLKYLP